MLYTSTTNIVQNQRLNKRQSGLDLDGAGQDNPDPWKTHIVNYQI